MSGAYPGRRSPRRRRKELVIDIFIAAVELGAIYSLVALGFVVIYRAVGAINFAHGDLVTVAAYVAAWVATDLELPLGLGWLAALVVLAVLGALIYAFIYRPMSDRPFIPVAIATLGLGIALRAGLFLVFGPDDRPLASPVGTSSVEIAGTAVSGHALVVIGVAFALVLLQVIVFRTTHLGKSMQAAAEDAEVARLLGLNADRLTLAAFVYGCALAGVAGVLLGPITFVSLDVGFEVGFKGFVAAIVGGFGSFTGAVLGAFVVAFSETYGAYYISTGYRNAIAFAVLVVVLLARPNGIIPTFHQDRA